MVAVVVRRWWFCLDILLFTLIFHARVTHFHSITIEDLVEWNFGRKMLADKVKKILRDNCFHCFAERRVKPLLLHCYYGVSYLWKVSCGNYCWLNIAI